MQISPDDFHYRIDPFGHADKRIEEVIAFVSDLAVARAAYEAAVKAKPGKRIHVAPACAGASEKLPHKVEPSARLASMLALCR